MARTIGIGVIGMGWMGTVHSRSYRNLADRFHSAGLRARMIVCADDVEARAQAAQSQFGFERSTTDWMKVVDDPAVDVVVVATPNNMHVPIVKAVAAAGKHVFCEKPVGRNSQETATIEAAARQAGIISGVGYNYRWAPVVQYARQLIRDGKLGQITHYRGRFILDYGASPDVVLSWRFDREVSGWGVLGDIMSHVSDMAMMLIGPITRAISNQATFITERALATPGEGSHFTANPNAPKGPVTNDDYVSALVQFDNGALGTFEVTRVATGQICEMAFELNGTQGAIKWNYERMNELQLNLPDGTDEHAGLTLIQASPQHPQFAKFYPGAGNSMGYDDLKAIEAFQFASAVAKGKPSEPGFSEALAVAEVLDAMERSWESGRWEDVQKLEFS